MTSIELERLAAMSPEALRAAAISRNHGDGPLTVFANALHAELLERGIAAGLLDEPMAFRPRLLPATKPVIEDELPCGA